MLIEHIEKTQGNMLSDTWSEKQHDTKSRRNFFQSLSQILLSISKTPLPCIGSFIINKQGYLTLSNRPLLMELHQLENEGVPTDIQRDYTYSTVESYVADILGVHGNRLKHQPNAVNDVPDCGSQISALATMRTLLPLFFNRDLRRGPFIFMLTDLHPSNIFVDDSWNITCLVDLEWGVSRPTQMAEPPYWLTNKGVDEIEVEEYDELRQELMSIMRMEEDKVEDLPADGKRTPLRLSEILERNWSTGAFWYSLALSSPTGLFRIFYERIHPLVSKHSSNEIGEIMPFYWTRNAARFVMAKLDDKRDYDEQLQLAFTASPEGSS